MMRWIPIGVATLLLALAPACKKQTTQTATAESVPGAAERITDEDKEFMTKAAQGSMFEVTLGQQVAANASHPDVKAFGHRMVVDHGKAHEELKQIAANKGLTLPTQLKDDHQEDVSEMARLSGPKLDAEYTEEMVEDHENDVKEFREATREVKDPELRAWAAKTLPILEQHLEQARQIKAKVAPESD